ncbi:MAG TPA: serine hydrolase [Pyrinomonadaceae bacterium]|nr:serine hydrolase [Pyrinomonadaceae bacterium]
MRTTTNLAPKFAALLLLLLSPCAHAAAQEARARLEEYMNASARADRFSGAVLVARDGKPVFVSAYGTADAENDVPLTPQHKFRLGSITKQFTAAAVMLLQERGKLSVQDPVCKHVAPCPEAWRPVTLHHLLTHTSGVPSFTSLPDYKKTEPLPSPVESTLARFRDLPLEFAPGESFNYSNSGYVLLGHVIERVSGKPYAEFVRQEIFAPLGMNDSGYDDPSRVVKRRARGYTFDGDELRNAPFLDMTIPHAAGALYSTVGDLLLWDQALYTEKLLPRRAVEQMFTPARNGYAYGWASTRLFDRPLVTHNGGINGFTTNIMRFTGDRVTVVVLSNVESPHTDRVARDLAAVVFGQPYRVPAERAVAKVDPKLYDDYAGEYQLAPAFSITITREGDRLFAQATGQPRFEIFPESETVFFLKVVEARLTFRRDEQGRVTGLVLDQGGRQMPAGKVK